jgi:asparagine synthase (glutamine-hydrolysing)
VPRRLDYPAFATTLFGLTVPRTSAFSSIKEVKPGCYVEICRGGVPERPYWSLELEPAAGAVDPDALTQNFLDVFDEAVRVRPHGDYPIGVYLSGGIDSSAVLASMVHSGARSIKAFTIGFDDKLLDERQAAVTTTSRLGVEHYVVPVRDKDISDNFLNSIWHSEIPVINTHGTAKFLLSRAVRTHAKAVMTGEGADELFAGYPYFTAGVPGGRRAGIAQQLANWSQLLGSRQFVSGFLAVPREKDVNRLIALFGCVPYLGLRSLFYGRFIRAHLSRDFLRFYSPLGALAALAEQVAPAKLGAMPQVNVDRFMAAIYDLPAYQLNFLADRQEMAHSIEGRVPFLDNNVAAFAAALPSALLTRDWAGKSFIRKAFAKRLPSATLASQKKIFLSPPTAIDDILRSDWGASSAVARGDGRGRRVRLEEARIASNRCEGGAGALRIGNVIAYGVDHDDIAARASSSVHCRRQPRLAAWREDRFSARIRSRARDASRSAPSVDFGDHRFGQNCLE